MNDICSTQNSDKLLRILKAQRSAYDSAKNHSYIDLITIILALINTLSLLLFGGVPVILSIFGVFWTITSAFSQTSRKKATKIGAKLQEMFDTRLFKIDWNEVLVKDKIDNSQIIQLSNKAKDDKIKDWYPTKITSEISHKIAVLLCFKSNVYWGLSLRKQYFNLLTYLVSIYLIILIIYFLVNGTALKDVVLSIAPSIPFFVYCVNTINSHREVLNSYDEIGKIVDKELIKFKNQGIETSDVILRQIQDLFYTQRLNINKVPNFYYSIARDDINEITDEAIRLMIEDHL